MIIWFDWPLGIVAIIFFILSWFYGAGLLLLFRHNFRWSHASVIGILSVVCCTGTLVWYVRYGNVAWDLIWSLFVVFSAALPGMLWADIEMRKDRQQESDEIIRLRYLVKEQDDTIKSQEVMMKNIKIAIKDGGDKTIEQVRQVLDIHLQAANIEDYINFLN